MKRWLIASAAAIPGILILAGYIYPASLPGYAAVNSIQSWLLAWAVTLSALAVLMAVFSVLRLHWSKVTRSSADPAALAGLTALILTVAMGLYSQGRPELKTSVQQTIGGLLFSLEGALFGLLAITLTYTAARLLRRRRGILSGAFLAGVLVFLLLNTGWLGFLAQSPFFAGLLDFLEQIPVAGGRGLLIGLAIGAMLAGLRVLVGQTQDEFHG